MDTFPTLFNFAETFEGDFNVRFCNAKTRSIADDVISSWFLNGASYSSCMRRVRVAKFTLRCLWARDYVGDARSYVFGTANLGDEKLRSSNDNYAVLLLHVAQRYFGNPNRLKSEFPEKIYYAAGKKYGNALHVLYTYVSSTNPQRFSKQRSLGF